MRIPTALAVAFLATAVLPGGEGWAALPAGVEFKIEAQALPEALSQFAHQSGYQLLFQSQIARHLQAPRVVGTLAPEAALKRLLANTGLGYRFVNERTVRITGGEITVAQTEQSSQMTEKSKSSTSDPKTQDLGESDASEESGIPDDSSNAGIPEILIKGSKGKFSLKGRSLNADIERTEDDVQPYVVLDRESIERSGVSTVGELLRDKLTMGYSSTLEKQRLSSGFGNQSSVSLRGLDQSQTLILVDGRRLGKRGISGGEYQGDLNGIPLAAIERIEVLPATASGIYGGGATGGVVNVILKRDYSGVTPVVTYENTTRGDNRNRRASVVGGAELNKGRTSLMFSASFSDAEPPRFGDRQFLQDYRTRATERSFVNNPQNKNIPTLGGTTNISSVPVRVAGVLTVPNLVLKNGTALNSSIASVPTGYAGYQSDNGVVFVQTAGAYNFLSPNSSQSGGLQTSLVADTRVRSVSATLEQTITSSIRGFLDLSVSGNESNYHRFGSSVSVTVPQSAPTNPFGQSVRVNIPLAGLDGPNAGKSTESRGIAGLIFSFPRDWGGEVDYAYDRNTFRQTLMPDGFTSALNSAVTTGAIDVFADSSLASVDWTSYLLKPSLVSPTHSFLRTATARLAGPIGRLPGGGRPIISMMVERVQENYGPYTRIIDDNGEPFISNFTSQSSRTFSAYVEARLPFISEENRIPGIRELEVQLSGRRDDYEMDGGRDLENTDPNAPPAVGEFQSTNPTVGFRLQPIRLLAFRASHGKGFLPPALALLQESVPTQTPTFTLTDPKRGGELIGSVTVTSGGRRNLLPEKSKSWSAGVVLTPPSLPGLRASVDWVRIEKTNNIIYPSLIQETINREDSIPGLLTRSTPAAGDPFGTGRIIGFDSRARNAASAFSESYDFSLDFRFLENSTGTWTFSTSATRLLHNKQQVNLLLPEDERAGLISSPSWSAIGTLSWKRRNVDVAWTTRYVDGVWVSLNHQLSATQGSARVESTVIHDLFIAHRLGEQGSKLTDGLEVQVGIKNVLDTKPPFFAVQPNQYDTRLDPVLRSYYITLKRDF